MSSNKLPNGWKELGQLSSDDDIGDALRILKQTHPILNYIRLTSERALELANIDRDYSPGVRVKNLRMFWSDDKLMSLFFFIRLYRGVCAYCMTVGVDANLPEDEIRRRIIEICKHMQGEPPGVRLEVISENVSAKGRPFFRDRANLDAAFDEAIRTKTLDKVAGGGTDGKITLGFPWPDEVHSWEIHPQGSP
jgi:hypothetical protein